MGFTIRGHYAISFTENASNLVFSEVESPMRISYFIDDNVIVDNVELHPDANGEVTIHVRQLVRLIPSLDGPYTTTKNLPQVAWSANKGGESMKLGSYLMPGGVSKPFDTASSKQHPGSRNGWHLSGRTPTRQWNFTPRFIPPTAVHSPNRFRRPPVPTHTIRSTRASAPAGRSSARKRTSFPSPTMFSEPAKRPKYRMGSRL